MGMTRQLFSISALAVELGHDRRTIAAALDTVTADGTIAGGHRGWFLQTALRALNDEAKVFDPATGPLGNLLDRVENWRTVHKADSIAWTVEEMASVMGKPVSAVLTWLRAGCPYLRRGDFETGAGFELRPAWVLDWVLFTSVVARTSGDKAGAAKLNL